MRMFASLWVAVILGLGSAACETRPIESLTEEDVAAVREYLDRWLEANRSNDPGRLAALVSEDGVLMLPGMAAIEGRAAFLDFLRALQYENLEVSATAAEIDGRGDMAYIRGTFRQRLALGGQPEPVVSQGNYLFLLRKQPDGSWLSQQVIWTPGTPPDGAI